MRSREVAAFSMVLILLLTPVGGCFSDSATAPTSSDLSIDAEVQDAGFFIDMTFRASKSMSVYIPYLLIDPVTMFVQNSTVIDLDKGGSETISILAPPRTDMMLFMIGEEGRENWPVRQQNESWVSWLARGGEDGKFPDAITRVLGENSTYDTVNATSDTGGEVAISTLSIMRGMSVGIEEGGVHSSGLLHGRLVYERLQF